MKNQTPFTSQFPVQMEYKTSENKWTILPTKTTIQKHEQYLIIETPQIPFTPQYEEQHDEILDLLRLITRSLKIKPRALKVIADDDCPPWHNHHHN